MSYVRTGATARDRDQVQRRQLLVRMANDADCWESGHRISSVLIRCPLRALPSPCVIMAGSKILINYLNSSRILRALQLSPVTYDHVLLNISDRNHMSTYGHIRVIRLVSMCHSSVLHHCRSPSGWHSNAELAIEWLRANILSSKYRGNLGIAESQTAVKSASWSDTRVWCSLHVADVQNISRLVRLV